MFICDTHCDTISELYKNEVDFFANKQHIDVERILKNGGGLQFCALFIPTEQFRYHGGIRYTLTLLDKYKTELKKLAARGVDVHPILTKADATAALQHKFNPLLAIEEGGALGGSLAALRMYYELGVRALTLVWSNRNDIADGVNEDCTKGGLTTFGRQVVAEMNRLGMAVDVSHMSTYGFWDTLATSSKPIIATHSNAYSLCDQPRNLNDEQIKALGKNNGFIGINFYADFLEKDYHQASSESIYKHLAYMLDLLGDDDHVGFGTDFDGIDHTPVDIQGVQDLVPLVELLTKKFGDQTVAKITHQNCLNYLQRVL
ncbi:MAG: dipeptidase [Acidaminococcaceae bacterium]|jgi:membrane dipeptidase|nr:dipeptidase [Acidaminococcaceae bacterium]